MSASNPGPMFMMVVAIVFSFGVAYIAHRGVTGSTAVNIAINVIQISALIVFAVMALGYRMNHPPGSVAFQFDSQTSEAYSYEFATAKTMVNGQLTDTIVRDADGTPQSEGCRRQAGAVSHQLSGEGCKQCFCLSSHGALGCRHAQFRLDVRAGDGCDSDPGRI